MTSRATSRRLTVQEAAGVLGTSVDAVRMRVRRGSLESEKDPDGRVYVWVDSDESETRREAQVDGGPLVEVLSDQVAYLRSQLDQEREARRRADTIIAQLTQANAALASSIPAIEAPESPESPVPSQVPTETSDEPQTGSEGQEPRRSWWREFFGIGG